MSVKEKKKKILEDLKEELRKQKFLIFISIKGVKANELTLLRKSLKEKNCQMKVIKKSIANLALKELKIDMDLDNIKEEMAVIFAYEISNEPAKILDEFSRTTKTIKIFGGMLGGKIISEKEIIELARLPSYPELIAQIFYTLRYPILKFVDILRGNILRFILALISLKGQRENI